MNEEKKDLEAVVLGDEEITDMKTALETENKKPVIEKTPPVAERKPEIIPSMTEFEDQIKNSFKKIKEGDILKGTVIGISDTEVTLDLNYYSEGIIKLEELSNDPRFSIKADIKIGEEISATVIGENREGSILLSRKQADDVLAWDVLKDMMRQKTTASVKAAQVVNGGIVTYLNGIRAFIPASQLALTYVENLESFVGRELEVTVITVDEDNKKLVLSAKEVAKEKALQDKNSRIAKVQIGLVTKGIVEKIMPFGAFVNVGEDLSGLVHISQICGKRIKSPNEVIKEGDEVTVKIIDVKDGKISLSMKAVEEKAEVIEDAAAVPFEYTSGGDATTGLGALLKNIKL